METPGRKTKHLQPYTIPELFARTFQIYRRNIGLLVIPVALVIVPLTAINSLLSLWTLDQLKAAGIDATLFTTPGRSATFFTDPTLLSKLFGVFALVLGVGIGISVIGSLIVQVLVNGLVTYITSENVFGRQPALGETLAAVRGRLGSLSMAMIAYLVIVIGLAIALTLILFACGLGFGVLVYVGLILSAFIAPVMILERVGVGEGIRRAWALGKARIWPLLAFMATFLLLSFAVGLAVGTFTGALYGHSSPLDFNPTIELVQFVLSAVTSIFLTPLLPIGYTLVYYDARVRHESLDVALATLDKFEARPSDVESPHPVGPFMSSDDLMNMGLLTVGLFILILIYTAISYAGGGRGAL